MQVAEEAEDVVQDTMARLWNAREKLPPEAELLPYMIKVTRNICIDRLRARQESEPDTDIENIPSDDGPMTDNGVEDRDRLRQVTLLIKQLPADQQRAIKLKAMDDLSNEQIARLTGWQQDNIRQLLSRARKKLKEMAQKQGLI